MNSFKQNFYFRSNKDYFFPSNQRQIKCRRKLWLSYKKHTHVNHNTSRRLNFSVNVIHKIYTAFCMRIIRLKFSSHLPFTSHKNFKNMKNINVVLIARGIKLISFISWELTWRNAYRSAGRSESSTDKKLPDQNQNPRVVKSQQVEKKHKMLWPLRIYPIC